MDKEQKAAAVEEIAERLGEADAIFAVDYRGLSVPDAAELRGRLREADATFRVVKNRLAKRAAEKAGTPELDELLDGPIALTFVKGDAVVAAKAIFTFSRQHEVLEYRGGLMDGEALDPEKFGAIARLPGLDVLHGQLVGVTASPLTGLTRGLASMLSGLAVGLGQIAEKGLVAGGEEAKEASSEPAEEEQPADEDQPAEAEQSGQEEQLPDEPEASEEESGGEAEAEAGGESETSESSETESSETETESDEAAEESGDEGSDSEGQEAKEE